MYKIYFLNKLLTEKTFITEELAKAYLYLIVGASQSSSCDYKIVKS